jgi:hypothetical protein
MNVGIGTVVTQFLFWEYLIRIFGIVSLPWVAFIHDGWIWMLNLDLDLGARKIYPSIEVERSKNVLILAQLENSCFLSWEVLHESWIRIQIRI